ncbi:hypothetical protein ES703_111011 [subsurface metagenome]
MIKNYNYKIILRKLFYRFIPKDYQKSWKLNFRDFIDEFKKYKFRDYFKIILITSISWFLYYVIVYFLALGINIEMVPFWVFGAAATLSSLVGMLPISVSGVGTRDAIFILIFSQYGIIFETSIALSFMVLLILFITPALVGLICSFFKPLLK